MGQGKYLSTLALKLLQNRQLFSHFFKKKLKLTHYKIVWKIATLNNDLFKILLLCQILKDSLYCNSEPLSRSQTYIVKQKNQMQPQVPPKEASKKSAK